jgi:Mg2+/Co2+ transporter CorB
MKLRLKENPREWLKFTAVMALMMAALTILLFRRRVLGAGVVAAVFPLLFLMLIACLVRPRWFRGFYRAGMTLSFHVGQGIGSVLLTIFFVVVVTPLGLLLRLFGKDLLHLKQNAEAPTYWQTAKSNNEFDRQF